MAVYPAVIFFQNCFNVILTKFLRHFQEILSEIFCSSLKIYATVIEIVNAFFFWIVAKYLPSWQPIYTYDNPTKKFLRINRPQKLYSCVKFMATSLSKPVSNTSSDLQNDICSAACDFIKRKGLLPPHICGVSYSGIPFAVLVANKLKLPLLIRNKEINLCGNDRRIEGNIVENGEVLVIEEVMCSGTSTLQVIKVYQLILRRI